MIEQKRIEHLKEILKPGTFKSILKEYESIRFYPDIMQEFMTKDNEIEKFVS